MKRNIAFLKMIFLEAKNMFSHFPISHYVRGVFLFFDSDEEDYNDK